MRRKRSPPFCVRWRTPFGIACTEWPRHLSARRGPDGSNELLRISFQILQHQLYKQTNFLVFYLQSFVDLLEVFHLKFRPLAKMKETQKPSWREMVHIDKKRWQNHWYWLAEMQSHLLQSLFLLLTCLLQLLLLLLQILQLLQSTGNKHHHVTALYRIVHYQWNQCFAEAIAPIELLPHIMMKTSS